MNIKFQALHQKRMKKNSRYNTTKTSLFSWNQKLNERELTLQPTIDINGKSSV